ncbi:MAG: sugar phosphate isomerase/epimerase [Verrucomicrobia bacterium]|nr:sugar phosphate isomerase/epimerase [Verrucomicrobiota bacterium]
MAKPIIGAQLYTVRAHIKTIKDIERTLAKVRAIGYTTVQMSGQGPVDARELAAVVRDSGVKAVASHVGFDRMQSDVERVIEEHKLMGCTHTAVPWLPHAYMHAAGLARFIREVTPVARALTGAGISVSYHNHHQELVRVGSQSWLEALLADMDGTLMKAEFDTYWVQTGGGDPATWIARYPGRQPLLHLKDMVVVLTDQGAVVRMAEIGEGNMAWPQILKAAEQAGVEQDDCYERDPFESLAMSYRYLQSLGYA